MSPFRIILAALLTTLIAPSGNAFGQIARDAIYQIVQQKRKSIGICPIALTREAEKEDSLNGAIGPLRDKWAENMHQELVAAARGKYRGQFSVKPLRQMQHAFRGASADDLGDPKFLKKLTEDYGVDSLVIVTAVETGGSQLNTNVEVQDLIEGTTVFDGIEHGSKNLSLAAYSGSESWEIRRWITSDDGAIELDHRGLDMESPAVYGVGRNHEQTQYETLRPNLPHPLDPDSGCPYGFEVLVGDEARSYQVSDDGQKFVALDPGDEPRIRVWNNGPKDVYMALYVDGINTINERRETPEEVPTGATWWLAAGRKPGVIRGWFRIQDAAGKAAGNLDFAEGFRIVPKEESVAGGERFTDRVGTITAVFFTHGMDGIPEAAPKTNRLPPTTFYGIGKGHESRHALARNKSGKEKGIILAAMSVHYRTSEQLREWGYKRQQKLAGAVHKQTTGSTAVALNDETTSAPRDGNFPDSDETVSAPR